MQAETIDIEALTTRVKENCNIADANYWGYFSMCNLLMRLRELYCHEHSLMPWDHLEKASVSAWIADREALWEKLEEKDLLSIQIAGKDFDAFAVAEINELLCPEGFIYGAGFGLLKKPTFFLGRILEARESEGIRIWIVEEELCRDLAPHFAMSQGNEIIIRQDVLNRYLYQQTLEIRGRSPEDFLHRAYQALGISPDGLTSGSGGMQSLERLSHAVMEMLVLHEMGEIAERHRENPWMEIVAATEDRLTEFRLRGIKDILADTSPAGGLHRIIEKAEPGMLFLYAGMQDEIRKSLFPEFVEAAERFAETGDWALISRAATDGRRRLQNLASEILDRWQARPDIRDIRPLVVASCASGEKASLGSGDSCSAPVSPGLAS